MASHLIERLDDGVALLEVSPAGGGAITRYAAHASDGLMDYLRPATPAVVERGTPTGMACFPLVPFSNRIRDGRFTFRGREVELPPNFPPEPHAIHGDGWQSPWEVVERAERELVIEYRHEPGAWPYRYRARQRFTLEDGALEVDLSLINESEEPMPAGYGLHPFFVRTPQTTVSAKVERVWVADAGAIPDRLIEPPPEWSLESGLSPGEVALDNNFTGWSGRAVLSWPEREETMTLTADEPFGVLVVYSPPGEPFVCLEPATNAIDAFNLASAGHDDTGMIVLPPGGVGEGVVRFEPGA